jgi:3-hydroxyacyl-[acyl-carrier-protein] dehydratase
MAKNGPTATESDSADILRVMDMIPHRFPMLMVDRVVDIVADESAVGIKNVTINEPHFQGHFPQRPVMPGVMIVEAMAQTAAVLVVHTLGGVTAGQLVYFMAIENARFRKPVGPGDTMRIHVTKTHSRGNVWKFSAQATVDDTRVAEAAFTAMIMNEQSD